MNNKVLKPFTFISHTFVIKFQLMGEAEWWKLEQVYWSHSETFS